MTIDPTVRRLRRRVADRARRGAEPTAGAAGSGFGADARRLDPVAADTQTEAAQRRSGPGHRPGHRPDRGRDGRRARAARDAARQPDPHQGRRGRPGPSSTPRSDLTHHAALPPEHPRPPGQDQGAARRLGRRHPRDRVHHAQDRDGAVVLADRERASTPPRPARSRPRWTSRASPTSCSNNGTALAVQKSSMAQARIALASPGRAGVGRRRSAGLRAARRVQARRLAVPAAGHLPACAGG